jgi:hypothetical protein
VPRIIEGGIGRTVEPAITDERMPSRIQAHLLQRRPTAEQLGTRPPGTVRDPGLHNNPPTIFPAGSLTARRNTSKHESLIRRLPGMIVGSA